jgi:signal transduction histidine kinase
VVISGQGETALVRVLAAASQAPQTPSRRDLLKPPAIPPVEPDDAPLPGSEVDSVSEPMSDLPEQPIGGAALLSAASDADDLEPPPRPRTDSETLAEIARRIRMGTGGSAAEAHAVDPTPAQAPVAQIKPDAPAAPAQRLWSDLEIAKLAHELRTPIAAIAALAEIMRDERLGAMGNSRYRGYAADVHDSAQHALALLTELGNDAGGLDSDQPRTPQIIDANAIISSCVSLMRPLADRAGVQLTTSLAARLPAIEADARSLKQILLNLLSNAVRHTPHAGEITVTSAHRLGGAVRIEVRDTGAGMAEHEIANALDPNVERGPNSRSPGGSTGFGLPLVRALAAANGAELQIDSRPGAGTRIALTFRAERAVPANS